MSFISTTILTILIIIPIVPLFAYVIGLLVPASHIVSRSSTFKISSKRLWNILIDVNKYPQWQPKVEKVIIIDDDSTTTTTTSDNIKQTVFIEYSTKKRHTVIIHHERIENQCLLRILEERPVATAPAPSKIPTFSGSWTFDIIISQEKEENDQVTLKITEQGVIKKPIVRVTHLLLFGFHSRIDRFMNDLHKKIDANNQEVSLVDLDEKVSSKKEQEEKLNAATTETVLLSEEEDEQQKIGEYHHKQQHPTVVLNNNNSPHHNNNIENDDDDDDTSTAAVPIIGGNKDTTITDDDSQLVEETNDTLMTESKIQDKEWDLMSEIYERTTTPKNTADTTTITTQ